MKMINIAPTWAWTAGAYFAFVAAQENPRVLAGFREELYRLGPSVRYSLRVFHSKKQSFEKKEAARERVMLAARECDKRIAEKEKRK